MVLLINKRTGTLREKVKDKINNRLKFKDLYDYKKERKKINRGPPREDF